MPLATEFTVQEILNRCFDPPNNLLRTTGGGGGGGVPGGANTQIQFNDEGAFGGNEGATYDKATNVATLTGGLRVPKIYPTIDSATAIQFLKADGTTSIVNIDTLNDRVGFGTISPNEQIEITKNFRMPKTTADAGIIKVGADRFIHNFGVRNTFIGLNAGNLTLTGSSNTALGQNSLSSNTSGSFNVSLGDNTLSSNTTGILNTAVGAGAIYFNTTGIHNTAIGGNALSQNTTGSRNVSLGVDANSLNKEGSNNTIIGFEAGKGTSVHNKSGNVFLGYQAGYNETGSNKLYIENSAANSANALIYGEFDTNILRFNANVGIDKVPSYKLDIAGTVNMTGFRLPTGAVAGRVLTCDANGVGTWQAVTGGGGGWTDDGTIVRLTTATDRVGIGSPTVGAGAKLEVAGRVYQSGLGRSTFFGYEAGLNDDLSDNYNVFIGYRAGRSNTTAYSNTALGFLAFYANTTGSGNTALGAQTLFRNTTGYNNIAVGHNALYTNTTGYRNNALGNHALQHNTGGFYNVALGYQTLYVNTTGTYNTALGCQALFHSTTGHNNIGIGYNAQVPNATGSNQIRMGNVGIIYAGIQVGWTVTSDRRVKTDIKEVKDGLSIIKKLKPVSFIRRNTLKEGKDIREFGFISQDVEKIQFESFGKNVVQIDLANGKAQGFKKGIKTLRYDDFIPILVKAVQEQQSQIEELKAAIRN